MSKIRKNLIKKEAGFTLIELLIVIGVLGILVAIAIPRIGGITEKAKLAEAQSSIGSIRTSLELIYSDKGSYVPSDTDDSYKNSADLLAETDLGSYLDNISDKWEYNISAVTDNYLIEVIGNGVDYSNTLKASMAKGDSSVTTTTENTDTNASTSP
jgi:general secretion pathway protein G